MPALHTLEKITYNGKLFNMAIGPDATPEQFSTALNILSQRADSARYMGGCRSEVNSSVRIETLEDGRLKLLGSIPSTRTHHRFLQTLANHMESPDPVSVDLESHSVIVSREQLAIAINCLATYYILSEQIVNAIHGVSGNQSRWLS